MFMKKSALKVTPKTTPTSTINRDVNDPKRKGLMESLEFMNETWNSLYKRSSMMESKSLDIQMLAFSISAVLQKTQAYIQVHHHSIHKEVVPKLKETLQQIKSMITGLLNATQQQFESHEKLLIFIHDNYVIVDQFNKKLRVYLLNEIEKPTPLKIERPNMLSFANTPTKERLSLQSIGPQSPSELKQSVRDSVRSSVSNGSTSSPLKERKVFAISKPKVTLLEDGQLDKFVCNEVLKCYHYIIQRYPRTKSHLPLLDLSGNADQQDELILSHFLKDLCDGVIFCRLFNIFAEERQLDYIKTLNRPKEWFDRMELIRKCQSRALDANWDLYTIKAIAIDSLSISKKSSTGNKHVCALFIKFIHSVCKDLYTDSWEENVAKWLYYSKSPI